MLNKKDKETILEISRKYKAKRVLLFGSSLDPDEEGRDIDLAVEGIAPREFFKYYGDLMLKLSKPVDLIDLSEKSKFTELVKREGLPVYG